MERATYGDIIGLQPGFERLIEPSAGPAVPDAAVNVVPKGIDIEPAAGPARVIKAAVQPTIPTFKPVPQYVQRVEAPPFTISLTPQERPETLLTRLELKALKIRQAEITAARNKAIKELKAVRKITVAATPHDLGAIQSIANRIDAAQTAREAMLSDLAQAETIAVSALGRPETVAPTQPWPLPDVTLTAMARPETLLESGPGTIDLADTPIEAVAVPVDNFSTFELALAPLPRPGSLKEKKTANSQAPAARTLAPVQEQPLAPIEDIRLTAMARPETLVRPVETLPSLMRRSLAEAPIADHPLADFKGAITQQILVLAQSQPDAEPLQDPLPTKPVKRPHITRNDTGDWQNLVDTSTLAAAEKTVVDTIPVMAQELAPPVDVASSNSAALPDLTIDESDEAQPAQPSLTASPETVEQNYLTREQSLDVIDMVGLPGDSKLLNVANEDRATIVASVKTTSTKYEARPIGLGGLETLRDAVEHAIATNPDIKIAEAQQEDAFYAVREARAGFLPKVDLNVGGGPEVSRQSGNEEITRIRRELNATLRQTVFDFGLTQFDYRRAKQNYESAKLETLQSVEGLTYEVAVAYLGVLQQQKVVALAQQNLEAHRYILNLVTAQKEAGQGTAADVNRVSSSLSNAESFMLEEESKLQQSRDEYRRLLDAPPGLLVDPLLDLSLLPQSAEDAADRSVEESPRLLQVKADTTSIRNQLRSHRGNFLPKVEMEVQGNLRTDVAGETGETRDARAMMFLRYNAFNGGADSAISARLRARIKEIGFEFEKQRREVEQSIRNDFTAIDASRAKVNTIDDQVNAAKEVVRLYEEQFRAGDRTAFDLLDAQQALINAKLEQILNSYQETRAAFRVLQQLGSLYYALTSDD